MQHIVIQTANPNPLLKEDGWFTNGVGRQFSHKFGYGLMDASALVDAALDWPGISPQQECISAVMNPNLNLAKKANDVVKVAVSTNGCKDTSNAINVLEHVVCKITLRHNPRGSLHIVLISPMGTRSSLLLPRPRDKTDSGFENWPFLSVHFWGEAPNGTWTLEVTQNEGNTRRPGVLKSWQLIMYGTITDLTQMTVPEETMEKEETFVIDENLMHDLDVDKENENNEIRIPGSSRYVKSMFFGHFEIFVKFVQMLNYSFG